MKLANKADRDLGKPYMQTILHRNRFISMTDFAGMNGFDILSGCHSET